MSSILDALESLTDRRVDRRLKAVETLTERGDKGAIAALIKTLGDRDWEVRMRAAESLGSLEATEAVPVLIEKLKDRHELVRVFAAESLGMIGQREAVPALIEALADSSWLVRGWVAIALGDIGDQRVLPYLEQALAKEKRDFVRLNIWGALFKMGRRETLPLMLQLLKSKTYRVRCAAVHLLTELADESNRDVIIEHMRRTLRSEEVIAVRSALECALSQLEKTSLPPSPTAATASRQRSKGQPSLPTTSTG